MGYQVSPSRPGPSKHDSPGKVKESNWLPAPAGTFNIITRLYGPKSEIILTGEWKQQDITTLP
jgi:hypothetical protein